MQQIFRSTKLEGCKADVMQGNTKENCQWPSVPKSNKVIWYDE